MCDLNEHVAAVWFVLLLLLFAHLFLHCQRTCFCNNNKTCNSYNGCTSDAQLLCFMFCYITCLVNSLFWGAENLLFLTKLFVIIIILQKNLLSVTKVWWSRSIMLFFCMMLISAIPERTTYVGVAHLWATSVGHQNLLIVLWSELFWCCEELAARWVLQ